MCHTRTREGYIGAAVYQRIGMNNRFISSVVSSRFVSSFYCILNRITPCKTVFIGIKYVTFDRRGYYSEIRRINILFLTLEENHLCSSKLINVLYYVRKIIW